MFFLGIDPGTKCYSWYAGSHSLEEGWTHRRWCMSQLVEGPYRLSKAKRRVAKWARGESDVISRCKLIGIEKQVKLRLINLQKCIMKEVMLYAPEDCVIMEVNPSAIKRMFSISTGTYRGNKRAAVELVRHILPEDAMGKLDDLADCFLVALAALCISYPNTYLKESIMKLVPRAVTVTNGTGGSTVCNSSRRNLTGSVRLPHQAVVENISNATTDHGGTTEGGATTTTEEEGTKGNSQEFDPSRC